MKKLNNFSIYLQLLEVFTIREIKSRYKASILGPLWIIIYPLMTTFFLSFVFEKIVKIRTGGISYYIFLLSGFLFWDFFSQGVLLAKESLIWNRDLVTKTTFSKETIPLSFIISKILDFIINLLILFAILVISGHEIKLQYLMIVMLIIPTAIFTAGIGLLFSITNAIFRYFGKIIDFFLLIFFYITPIIYSESFVPNKYKIILLFNPLSSVVITCRDMLFRNKFNINVMFQATIISLLIFFVGFYVFKKFEKKIVDFL